MAAERSSIAVRFARASLTLAATFGLTRVFAGRSWLFLMILAAVAPPAFLDWAQRRHWHGLVRLAVLTVGGAWLAAVIVDPSTTVAGIPTRATLGSLVHTLADATHVLRAAVVPVAPRGAALLLAYLGVFLAAALCEWIATALDAPIAALAPSIALFIVFAAVASGGWVAPTALYALATLTYLLSLAQRDLVTRRTWFHATQPHASRIVGGGALVAAMVVTAAVGVGPSVPGAGGSPLLDYKSLTRGEGGSLLSAPPPILSIKDKLTLGDVQELFTVKSSRAAYWRVIALDWFTDDNAWGVNKATEHNASKLTVPLNLPPSASLHQQFHIVALDPHWLPAAYQPVQINLSAARVVPESLTLLVDSKSRIGDVVYDVDSRVPAPSQKLLQSAGSNARPMTQDLELPRDFSQSVRGLAEHLTANAHGPYERAAALLHFFRVSGHFTYTLDTNLGDSPDAITQFLRTRAGFCEQFAATFAAMARAVGVPTRVAVGYQPGALGQDGLYHVTNRNAHAWPEVWIDGAGWIPFEPTPAFEEPTLGLGTGGPARQGSGSTPTTKPTGTTTPASGQALPTIAPAPGSGVQVQPPKASAPAHRTLHRVIVGVAFALVVAALGALAFLAFTVFTLWQRTRRRRNDRDPRRRVLGAWDEALDHLGAAGVPPRPTATSLEFALRHAPAHGAGNAGPALMELARLQSAAMFALDPPSATDATVAWEQVNVISAALRHSVPRSSRWRRRLRAR